MKQITFSTKYKILGIATLAFLVTGCATPEPRDYSAYKKSNPRSILVLPPINETSDVKATYGLLSQTTFPVAESGYYVLPVTLVDETFKENGLSTPNDIHAVAPQKLQEIFGADAGLYITVTKYGTSYLIIGSESRVTAQAKLVDLKTGSLLWEGKATASSQENNSGSGGGLVGLLVSAIVSQIIEHTTDASSRVAAVTSARLLSADSPNGLLYGPRSPKYSSNNTK